MCQFYRCFSWLNADMMDPSLVPAYVRQDYWWKPGCALEPLYNATLPYLAAAILPPILRSANIPGGDEFNEKAVAQYRARIPALS